MSDASCCNEVKKVGINEKVAEFEAEAFHKDEIKKIKLSDYKGKWVILFFYPADFTFVCPTELEEMAELYTEFQKAEAEVLSVSTDTAFVHKAWHDVSPAIKKINFPMVADPNHAISKQFWCLIKDAGLALRGSFVIDPDGVLKCAEVHDLGIGRSAQELLRKLQAAKFVRENKGEVCPAKWKPGQKTLKPSLDLVGKI